MSKSKTKSDKKKVVYQENYKRGQFEQDWEKVAGWAKKEGIWMEAINAGRNEDWSEFVTIRFDNITY